MMGAGRASVSYDAVDDGAVQRATLVQADAMIRQRIHSPWQPIISVWLCAGETDCANVESYAGTLSRGRRSCAVPPATDVCQ